MAFAKFASIVRIVEALAAFLIVILFTWGAARFFKNKKKNQSSDD
jgi:4-amino-4-deoxy-L-arabinose transferase-like glycosyltransferase